MKLKRHKYEEHILYQRNTYVLEGPGVSVLVLKSIKDAVGNRCGIGTDFLMICYRFGLPIWDPIDKKSITSDK